MKKIAIIPFLFVFFLFAKLFLDREGPEELKQKALCAEAIESIKLAKERKKSLMDYLRGDQADLSQAFVTLLAGLGLKKDSEGINKLLKEIETKKSCEKVIVAQEEKEVGPEVIINPYSDENEELKEKIEQLKKVRESKKGGKNKNSFNLFYDKFQGLKKPHLDRDILKEQWFNRKALPKAMLQIFPAKTMKGYLGKYEGEYRVLGNSSPATLNLALSKGGIRFKITGKDSILFLSENFVTYHSVNHGVINPQGYGGSTCRAPVLVSMNHQIQLLRVKGTNSLIVKFYRYKDGKKWIKPEPLGYAYFSGKKGSGLDNSFSGRY